MTEAISPRTPTRTLSDSDFSVAIEDRFFEHYEPGAVYEYGWASVTEAEIVDFASQFDPQPIHVDRAYAESGPFGGLIASGWHTTGIMMRLLADHYLSARASLASPGVDELRWTAPVRPGDAIRLRTTILEARPSASKPDRGLVRTRCELFNQDDKMALTLVAVNFLRRKP